MQLMPTRAKPPAVRRSDVLVVIEPELTDGFVIEILAGARRVLEKAVARAAKAEAAAAKSRKDAVTATPEPSTAPRTKRKKRKGSRGAVKTSAAAQPTSPAAGAKRKSGKSRRRLKKASKKTPRTAIAEKPSQMEATEPDSFLLGDHGAAQEGL